MATPSTRTDAIWTAAGGDKLAPGGGIGLTSVYWVPNIGYPLTGGKMMKADEIKALRRKHIKAKQNFSAQDILDKVRFMKGEK